MTSRHYLPLPVRSVSAPRPTELFAKARRSSVPKDGWTLEAFRTPNGAALVRDLLSVRKLAIRENASRLTSAVSKMFNEEMEEVIAAFLTRLEPGTGAKAKRGLVEMVLNLEVRDGTELLWEQALGEVFSSSKVRGRIMRVFRPMFQSVFSHIIKKARVLLSPRMKPSMPPTLPTRRITTGKPPLSARPVPSGPNTTATEGPPLPVTAIETVALPVPEISISVTDKAALVEADGLCDKVTRISETTRKQLADTLRKAMKGQHTIGGLIQEVREKFPQIAAKRIPTIVRNELSVAANKAQILSFKEVKTLTHCSVVGCQAVEDDGPKFMGFPTCNIRNVPVDRLSEVEFHINHTGSWVPSGFRKANGSVPDLPLGNSEGLGKRDARLARSRR